MLFYVYTFKTDDGALPFYIGRVCRLVPQIISQYANGQLRDQGFTGKLKSMLGCGNVSLHRNRS